MRFALSLLGFGICRASLSVLIVPRHFFLLLFFNEALCCHLGVRLYLRNLETLNTRLEHKLEFDNSVTIDKDLSFTRHISQICKQVKKQSSVFKIPEMSCYVYTRLSSNHTFNIALLFGIFGALKIVIDCSL